MPLSLNMLDIISMLTLVEHSVELPPEYALDMRLSPLRRLPEESAACWDPPD